MACPSHYKECPDAVSRCCPVKCYCCPPGLSGEQGPEGPDGPQGPQGLQGPQGSQGLQGPQGPRGGEGPEGLPGAHGPAGPEGIRGNSGLSGGTASERNCYLYAHDQLLAELDRVAFTVGINNSAVMISSDGKEIRIRQPGVYYIATAWSAKDDGALSMVLALNGVKIPYMNYITGTAEPSLVSCIPGWIIMNLDDRDVLSVINYAPETMIVTPENNMPPGSSSNAAATLTMFWLGF